MKKKRWIFISLLALILIIAVIVIINGNKQEVRLTASYSEETGQIVVKATRPYNRYEPFEYENRLSVDSIISLSERHTEENTDVFVFDILGNGNAEFAFYSIDPQDPNNKYKVAKGLKIVVTDEAVNVNNVLWRR